MDQKIKPIGTNKEKQYSFGKRLGNFTGYVIIGCVAALMLAGTIKLIQIMLF